MRLIWDEADSDLEDWGGGYGEEENVKLGRRREESTSGSNNGRGIFSSPSLPQKLAVSIGGRGEGASGQSTQREKQCSGGEPGLCRGRRRKGHPVQR